MRVLIITRIFPSSQRPTYAPYNRLQFGELAKLCQVEVWGLQPWFPLQEQLTRTPFERLPRAETIDDLYVRHPRVVYAPKFGRPLSGALYVASLAPLLAGRRHDFDLVVGTFAYPDGWAAVALSKLLKVPVVVHVLGSDVNLYGEDPLLRPNLKWAFRRAAAVVGPSQQLIDKSVALGAPAAPSRMIPNGVDHRSFFVRDRQQCREALGHGDDKRRWILCVGRLEPPKGLWELLEAFEQVHETRGGDTQLVMIGDGVDEDKCRAYVRDRNLPVLFVGRSSEVGTWCGASDMLTLPSWREGTPNVVLEALASGRRVVASDVGGIPDVMTDPLLGEMIPPKQAQPLAEALLRVLAEPYDPAAVAAKAAVPTWGESAAIFHDVLRTVHEQAR